mmetsp:Transcript_22387/g.19288  ORF Transcript_22387/g.19288 Transcript_22387/m.19288 type:complete len:209 (-) Transcript_22387:86-712(-)
MIHIGKLVLIVKKMLKFGELSESVLTSLLFIMMVMRMKLVLEMKSFLNLPLFLLNMKTMPSFNSPFKLLLVISKKMKTTPSVMVPPLMTLPLKMSLFSKLISLPPEPLTLMLVLLFLELLLPLLTKMLKKILTALLLDTKLMKVISLSMLTSNTKVLLLTSVDPSFSIWVMKKMLISLLSGGSLTSASPLWKTSMVPLMKTLPSLTKT